MTKEIGRIIKDLREKSGMSQAEMADTLGFKLRQYQNYEGGKSLTLKALEVIGEYHGHPFVNITGPDAKSLRPSYDQLTLEVLKMLQVSLDETAEIRASVQGKDLRVVKAEVNKKLEQGLQVGK